MVNESIYQHRRLKLLYFTAKCFLFFDKHQSINMGTIRGKQEFMMKILSTNLMPYNLVICHWALDVASWSEIMETRGIPAITSYSV